MPLTGCQLGHLAQFKKSWPLNKDYSEHLNERPNRPARLSQPFSYFCSWGNRGFLYGSQLSYLKPMPGWALIAFGFNNYKANLYYIVFVENFKNQRGKQTMNSLHLSPPTPFLLPDLWTSSFPAKLMLSCDVLRVWIPVGPSLWDTSEPCLHSMGWAYT